MECHTEEKKQRDKKNIEIKCNERKKNEHKIDVDGK